LKDQAFYQTVKVSVSKLLTEEYSEQNLQSINNMGTHLHALLNLSECVCTSS